MRAVVHGSPGLADLQQAVGAQGREREQALAPQYARHLGEHLTEVVDPRQHQVREHDVYARVRERQHPCIGLHGVTLREQSLVARTPRSMPAEKSTAMTRAWRKRLCSNGIATPVAEPRSITLAAWALIGCIRCSRPSRVTRCTKSASSNRFAARSKRRRTSAGRRSLLWSVAFIVRRQPGDAPPYHAFRRIRVNSRAAGRRAGSDDDPMRIPGMLLPLWQFACRSARAAEFAVMPRSCAFCGAARRHYETAICAGCAGDLAVDSRTMPRLRAGALPRSRRRASCAPSASATPRRSNRPSRRCRSNSPSMRQYGGSSSIASCTTQRPSAKSCAAPLRLLPGDVEALLPVPLHWARHAVRGFNQAAEICGPLRRATGLPVIRNVKRLRRTPYQSGLGARSAAATWRARSGCVAGLAQATLCWSTT